MLPINNKKIQAKACFVNCPNDWAGKLGLKIRTGFCFA
jgi:hypothetical protein